MKANISSCFLYSCPALLRRFLPMVLGAAILCSTVPAAVAQTVFATADNGTTDLFGTLNLATGQFTQVASGSTIFNGLTAGANGTIYGSAANGYLYTISTTGAATRYGTASLSNGSTNLGLAYNGGGFLGDYSTSTVITLYSVAAGGNMSSVIGNLQNTTTADAVASGNLAFGPGGILYFNYDPASRASSPAVLFSVDPATGAKTAIGTQLGTVLLTLVSTATTLYGIDTVDTSNIGVYTINTITGVATQISTLNGLPAGYTLDAATTVPEPSNWALLGLGGAGLGLVLRQRRRARLN